MAKKAGVMRLQEFRESPVFAQMRALDSERNGERGQVQVFVRGESRSLGEAAQPLVDTDRDFRRVAALAFPADWVVRGSLKVAITQGHRKAICRDLSGPIKEPSA